MRITILKKYIIFFKEKRKNIFFVIKTQEKKRVREWRGIGSENTMYVHCTLFMSTLIYNIL